VLNKVCFNGACARCRLSVVVIVFGYGCRYLRATGARAGDAQRFASERWPSRRLARRASRPPRFREFGVLLGGGGGFGSAG